jgi:phenylalanyl-tRNA synthetase beta chain
VCSSDLATTVCGAPNVRVGMKAVFADPGATLGDGAVVHVSQRAGRRSKGVLCAPSEIGLGSSREGLLELPAGTPAGTPIADLLPAADTLIEIDNKSLTHRPDLWGHYGFARELASIFDRPLRPYVTADLAAFDHLPPFDIQVDDVDGCPLYSAIALQIRGNPVSPLRMQARLATLGSTPINLLVDVTNYVQFELGQPTHAFDAAALPRVRVARAGHPREFVTLDGKVRKLLPDDLLIQAGDEPVALAGVMGGLQSKVEEHTRRIVLESANFRASRVRFTSVRLALRTDASLRFEKKLPPSYARTAAARIVHELGLAGVAPEALSRYSHVGDFRDSPRPILLMTPQQGHWAPLRLMVPAPSFLASWPFFTSRSMAKSTPAPSARGVKASQARLPGLVLSQPVFKSGSSARQCLQRTVRAQR